MENLKSTEKSIDWKILRTLRKIQGMENSAENPAHWKIWKICGSCTAAENLRKNPLTGKSAEKLENLECKVYLTFHGKSGARYSAENLTLICLENLQ